MEGMERANSTDPGGQLRRSEAGFTLFETAMVLILLGILAAIALNSLIAFIDWVRLSAATFELSQQWKVTRLDATGSGQTPTSLCMTEFNPGQIQYAQIRGDECESVASWQALTPGVSIDTANSTLRTVAGPAGNGGTIYRVSWADTRGGMGGSWGQLGRLVLTAKRTAAKKCLFLFDTDGSWNIREDRQCQRRQ